MIKYVTGDATKPIVKHGIRIIAHVCNDLGGWGSGFVVALSNRWDNPEKKYRNWHEVMKDQGGLDLGDIQLVQVRDEHGKIYVANMIAQHGYATPENPVAIRYGALMACTMKLKEWIGHLEAVKIGLDKKYFPFDTTIHMPRIGCGLAGGDWNIVSEIVEATLGWYFDVFVYDLPEKEVL